MKIAPVHYAPHHTDHLPLCGARTIHHGGNDRLLICTMDRDETTCFKCIDQYEERAATPQQMEALAQIRDEIDSLFLELEERARFERHKHATLHALAHMLHCAPWWALRLRFRLVRAAGKLRTMTFEDLND